MAAAAAAAAQPGKDEADDFESVALSHHSGLDDDDDDIEPFHGKIRAALEAAEREKAPDAYIITLIRGGVYTLGCTALVNWTERNDSSGKCDVRITVRHTSQADLRIYAKTFSPRSVGISCRGWFYRNVVDVRNAMATYYPNGRQVPCVSLVLLPVQNDSNPTALDDTLITLALCTYAEDPNRQEIGFVDELPTPPTGCKDMFDALAIIEEWIDADMRERQLPIATLTRVYQN